MYKEGAYKGKAKNKPRGAEHTPAKAWSTQKLVSMGMGARNTFEDVVLLRKVHRYADTSSDVPERKKETYRKEAEEFLKATRGMADCTWTAQQHAWLARRNRSALRQTAEGRAEDRKFDNAPLLMDGQNDTVAGAIGAIGLMKKPRAGGCWGDWGNGNGRGDRGTGKGRSGRLGIQGG